MHRCIVVFLLALAAGCGTGAGRPWCGFQGREVSDSGACARAAARLEAVFGGVARDAAAEDRMERIAESVRLASEGLPDDCVCRLLDSDRVCAASLPDGQIYITRGFYASLTNDSHLAAVIAHELAHIAAHDHSRGRCGDETQALRREMAADCLGILYLDDAGYERSAMVDAIRLISDHQPASWTEARLASAASAARVALPLAATGHNLSPFGK